METVQLPKERPALDRPLSSGQGDEAHPDLLLPAERERLVRTLRRRLLTDPEFRHFADHWPQAVAGVDEPVRKATDGQSDVLVSLENETHAPDEVFGRLRWGGLYIYASRSFERVAQLPERFRQRGFLPLEGPEMLRISRWGIRLPLWSPRLWYFVARKVYLIRPREISDRFTYHVQLVPRDDQRDDTSLMAPLLTGPAAISGSRYVVMKEIPSLERVIGRLRARFTDLPFNVIERRALNFTEKVFPLFLTREAAMLKVLERDLPPEYAHRVPHVLHLEKDGRGYVQRLWMNWLRNGGAVLSQIEFARQFAELLHVLHERANIVHLDLRLDNLVVTEHGVGFVDFGSAVRLGENIAGNTLLSTLFEELMKTSQIQRMLERMTKSGAVTSNILREAYGKVDKAVDLFFLAVQMSSPTGNPDLRGLIHYDVASEEAAALTRLRREVLRPDDPLKPAYRTAKDILDGINRLKLELDRKRA